MVEEDYRRRTNLHSSRQRPETQKKTTHMGLFRFQLVVCILCIAAAAIIKLVGGSFYTMVRSSVSNALTAPVTSSQIDQVFAAFKDGLPDVSGVFATSSGKSGASGASGASGSSGASSSASKSSSAAASSGAASSAAVSSAASSSKAV